MNLANIDSTPEFLEDEVSTILHETLHALGFEHEHQSPARPLIDEAGEYWLQTHISTVRVDNSYILYASTASDSNTI